MVMPNKKQKYLLRMFGQRQIVASSATPQLPWPYIFKEETMEELLAEGLRREAHILAQQQAQIRMPIPSNVHEESTKTFN
jgi:hypothetical protein